MTLLIGIAVLFIGFLRRLDNVASGRRRWLYISERRSSLPLTFRGSWSTNRIFAGHL